jgi:hypothetical protein
MAEGGRKSDTERPQATQNAPEAKDPHPGHLKPPATAEARPQPKNGASKPSRGTSKNPSIAMVVIGFFDLHNGAFNALFSGLVAAFTLLLYFVGRDQHKAAVISQRSWIKVDLIGKEFRVAEDAVRLACEITLTNMGSTPAINVMTRIRLWPKSDGVGYVDEVAAVRRVKPEVHTRGLTLFPNEQRDRISFPILSNADLVRRGIDPSVGDQMFEFVVGGVVTYEFAGGRGETPFALNIWTRKGGAGPWNATPSLSIQQLSEDNVRLVDKSVGLAAT